MKLHTPKTFPDVPVAPGAWPLIGHLPHLGRDQASFIRENERKLGPLFWIHQGFGQWSIVVSGEPAHAAMKNKSTRSDVMGGEEDRFSGYITENTMMVQDGSIHKRMRGSVNSPFTPKGLTSAGIGALLAELAEKYVGHWEAGSSLQILNETSVYALAVIFRMLGVPDVDLPLWRQKFNEFVAPWTIVPVEFPGTPRWRSRRAMGWLDSEFLKLIEEVRASGEQDTMLGAIVHGTDEHGEGLEEKELLANLRLLALAGHETTASTVAWMFLHLAEDESLWDEICEEVMAADGPPLSPKEMDAFPRTEALFREALRLYPVLCLLTPRRVEVPMEMHGVTIPKDTCLAVSLISLSRDPALYPEPDSLSIKRWTEREHKPRLTEAVQFGGGPHFCLGYHLAVFEGVVFTIVALRHMVQKGLRMTLPDGLPAPKFMPLTRPPAKSQIAIERHS